MGVVKLVILISQNSSGNSTFLVIFHLPKWSGFSRHEPIRGSTGYRRHTGSTGMSGALGSGVACSTGSCPNGLRTGSLDVLTESFFSGNGKTWKDLESPLFSLDDSPI